MTVSKKIICFTCLFLLFFSVSFVFDNKGINSLLPKHQDQSISQNRTIFDGFVVMAAEPQKTFKKPDVGSLLSNMPKAGIVFLIFMAAVIFIEFLVLRSKGPNLTEKPMEDEIIITQDGSSTMNSVPPPPPARKKDRSFTLPKLSFGNFTAKKKVAIAVVIILIFALPLTVFLVKQSQDNRQRAVGGIDCCRVLAANKCTSGFNSYDMEVARFGTIAECEAYKNNPPTFSYTCNCAAPGAPKNTCQAGNFGTDDSQLCYDANGNVDGSKFKCQTDGSKPENFRVEIINQALCAASTPPPSPTPTSTPIPAIGCYKECTKNVSTCASGLSCEDSNGGNGVPLYLCLNSACIESPSCICPPTPTPTRVPICYSQCTPNVTNCGSLTCADSNEGNGVPLYLCLNSACAGSPNCICPPTPTPTPTLPVVQPKDSQCGEVIVNKTILNPGDTVTMTGFGWVTDATDSIDQIKFTVTKAGVEKKVVTAAATRNTARDTQGRFYYSALASYTVAEAGNDYKVVISVHSVKLGWRPRP